MSFSAKMAYKVVTAEFNPLEGGLAENEPDSSFNKDSIEEGMKVEKEHTIHKSVQKRIAKDHLKEDPKYYKKLKLIEKKAEIEYQGKTFPAYNKPIASDRPEKKMMVLAKDGDRVKLIHFGQKGYKHNYSAKAKDSYLARSAGIKNKSGELTMNDKLSPNYWARKILWPK